MHTLRSINSDFTVYSGTENYYRHLFGGLFTDGVMAVAEKLHAYWLIDAVFSYGRKEEFQIWTLEVKNNQAILTMKEDSDRPFIVKQDIPFTPLEAALPKAHLRSPWDDQLLTGFTDFPEGILKMYFTNGVLLLPSEY